MVKKDTLQYKERPMDAKINKIILVPFNPHNKNNRCEEFHYIINENGQISTYMPIEQTHQKLAGKTWKKEKDIENTSIMIGLVHKPRFRLNDGMEKKETFLDPNKTENISNEIIANASNFLKDIESYDTYNKKNDTRILFHNPPINSKQREQLLRIATMHNIDKDKIISELDLLPEWSHDILPASTWSDILPCPEMEEIFTKDEQKTFALGERYPEIIQLRKDIEDIGYDLGEYNKENEDLLDERLFRCCQALTAKFLGIANLSNAEKKKAITTTILKLAKFAARVEREKQNKESAKKDINYIDRNFSFIPKTKSFYEKYKKEISDLKKDMQNRPNQSLHEPKEIAYGVFLITLALALSLLLGLVVIPLLPFAAHLISIIVQIICIPCVILAIGSMVNLYPESNDSIKEKMAEATLSAKKRHESFNDLAKTLLPEKKYEIKTVAPEPKAPKEKEGDFIKYAKKTFDAFKWLSIPIGIIIATIIFSYFFTIPLIVLSIIKSSVIVLGTLIGTYGSHVSNLSVMKEGHAQYKAFIENTKAENKMLRDVLKEKYGIQPKQEELTETEEKIKKINTKYKGIKRLLIFESTILVLAFIGINLIAFAPLPALILAAMPFINIISSFIIALIGLYSIKKFFNLRSREEVEVLQTIFRERDKMLSNATEHQKSATKEDVGSALSTKEEQNKTKIFQKMKLDKIDQNAIKTGLVLLSGGILLTGLIIFLPAASSVVLAAIIGSVLTLFAGLLIKHAIKAFLFTSSEELDLQRRLENTAIHSEFACENLMFMQENKIKPKHLHQPNEEWELLDLKRSMVLAKINKIEEEILSKKAKSDVYKKLSLPSTIFLNRLFNKHTAISMTILIAANIAVAVVASIFLAPAISLLVTTIFSLASALGQEAFQNCIFKNYTIKENAANILSLIELENQKTACVLDLLKIAEQQKNEDPNQENKCLATEAGSGVEKEKEAGKEEKKEIKNEELRDPLERNKLLKETHATRLRTNIVDPSLIGYCCQ